MSLVNMQVEDLFVESGQKLAVALFSFCSKLSSNRIREVFQRSGAIFPKSLKQAPSVVNHFAFGLRSVQYGHLKDTLPVWEF